MLKIINRDPWVIPTKNQKGGFTVWCQYVGPRGNWNFEAGDYPTWEAAKAAPPDELDEDKIEALDMRKLFKAEWVWIASRS